MAEVLAIGAVSPLGVGRAAWWNGEVDAPAPTRVATDARLAAAGLRRPLAANVFEAHLSRTPGVDPAEQLLLHALSQIESQLPRGPRIGVAIGTSSGGMCSAERLFALHAGGAPIPRELARAATYHAPFQRAVERLRGRGLTLSRVAHTLSACSASTIAIGLALRWIDAGECDLVVAGGYDALTIFVASGFEALGATAASAPPRPFRSGRDGMALGEGAALLLLGHSRTDLDGQDRARAARAPLAHVVGFGAAGDASHLTAPDRSGRGLANAALRALEDSGIDPSHIDLVSAHATSTPFNDPMEGHAIARALDRGRGRATPVHGAKASIGHTLGAAGAIETALVVDALHRGVLPATAGDGPLDPEVGLSPRSRIGRSDVRGALKLSAAFGGANAALVVSRAPDRPGSHPHRSPSPTETASADAPDILDLDALSIASGMSRDRLGRMDALCHVALAAVAELAARVGTERLRGAGIVLGTVLATLEVNALYAAGIRTRGAARGEARRFAYTAPNAAAGECAIAFGLTGPNVVVGRGEDAAVEAVEVARDLITGGDAERVVVVIADAPGDLSRLVADLVSLRFRAGARALLIERAPL